MSKQWNFLAIFALFIPSSLVLLLHAYLGSFSRFIADDFCSYYYAKELGVFQSALYWYRTWHGGYSVSFMDSLLVLIGPYGIPYVTPIVLFIWLAVTTVAIHLLLRKDSQLFDILKSISLGTAVVYSILLISPKVSQSLYWWGGMRAYVMPLIIFTFYIALFQWFRKRSLKAGPIFILSGVSFMIVFASGGFSETFTPVQLVIFVFIISYGLLTLNFRPKDKEFFFLLAGYFGALASLLAMVSAPGNAARQALYPEPADLFSVFDIAFAGFITFLQGVFSTPERLFGILGMILGTAWLGIQTRDESKHKFWNILICLVTGLVFTFLCFLPAAYGLSAKPYERTLIIPAYILVVGLLLASFMWGKWVSSKIEMRRFIHLGFFLTATTLIVLSAVIKSQELYASRHAYIDYARKWDQVDTQIIQTKHSGEELVLIPNMINWAGLDRPTDNPKFWLTACYTQYYGIQVLGPAWEW
jgi:hypothetical protein